MLIPMITWPATGRLDGHEIVPRLSEIAGTLSVSTSNMPSVCRTSSSASLHVSSPE